MTRRAVALVAALALAAGCTRTVYVPAMHTEAFAARTVERDTLIMLDSVHVVERADTVRLTTTRTLYRTRTVRDTVNIATTDTIRLPAPSPPAQGSSTSRLWYLVAALAGALTALLLLRHR